MTEQNNAAHEAVQAKPCPKQPTAPVYPTGQQTQAMALAVTQNMLKQLMQSLAQGEAVESEVDAFNAAEMACRHIAQMVHGQPVCYEHFMADWYMVASIINLAAQVLEINSSPLAQAMQQVAQHFITMADAVDYFTFTRKVEDAHAD